VRDSKNGHGKYTAVPHNAQRSKNRATKSRNDTTRTHCAQQRN